MNSQALTTKTKEPELLDSHVAWQPQKGGQLMAFMCPVNEILLHGNRGGGKSDLLITLFLRGVGQGYGLDYVGIIFRPEFKHLADLVRKSKKIIPKVFPTAKFKESTNAYMWKFPEGEELLFRHAKKAADFDEFHGHEIPFIGFDELTKFPSLDFYHLMKTNQRSPVAGMPKFLISATNPSGVSHNEVKAYFIDKAPVGKIITDESGLKRIHLKITFLQNKFIQVNDPEYIKRLEAIRDPMLKAAWLRGEWNIISGGAFDDVFDISIHVFDPTKVKFPEHWKKTRSFDWGSSKPFSVGWWLTCPEDTVIDWIGNRQKRISKGTKIRIAEWYGAKPGKKNEGLRMTNKEMAEGIKEREVVRGWIGDNSVQPGAADAAIFPDPNKQEKGIHDIFDKTGVAFEKAPKGPGSRITRMSLMRDRFVASEPDIMEEPGIFISENCPKFIEQIPMLKRDENDIEKVDTEQEDHLYDEASYEIIHYETNSGMFNP